MARSNLGSDHKDGFLLGVGGAVDIWSEILQLGLNIEYIEKCRTGYFSFFDMSTGVQGYQGAGEQTIGYIQPSVVLRSILWKGLIRPVGYFGFGAGGHSYDFFEKLIQL